MLGFHGLSEFSISEISTLAIQAEEGGPGGIEVKREKFDPWALYLSQDRDESPKAVPKAVPESVKAGIYTGATREQPKSKPTVAELEYGMSQARLEARIAFESLLMRETERAKARESVELQTDMERRQREDEAAFLLLMVIH